MTPQLYPDVLRYIASFTWNPENMRICKAWRNALRLSAIKEDGGLECVNLSNRYNSKAIVDMIGPRTQSACMHARNISCMISHPQYDNLVAIRLLSIQQINAVELPLVFPHKLQSLFIWGFKEIQKIPDLPITLKHLDIWRCSKIQVFPKLPPAIERIDIWSFPYIEEIPDLPESLRHLDLQNFSHVREIKKFPSFLDTLILASFMFPVLPKFPHSLRVLNLRYFPSMRVLPDFPPNLQCLTLKILNSLRVIPEFPPTLQHLSISCMDILRILPNLPPYLQSLELKELDSLEKIPDLPLGLQRLEISYVTAPVIPDFPKSLKYLKLDVPASVLIPPLHDLMVISQSDDADRVKIIAQNNI